jgi:hypothetical protein
MNGWQRRQPDLLPLECPDAMFFGILDTSKHKVLDKLRKMASRGNSFSSTITSALSLGPKASGVFAGERRRAQAKEKDCPKHGIECDRSCPGESKLMYAAPWCYSVNLTSQALT